MKGLRKHSSWPTLVCYSQLELIFIERSKVKAIELMIVDAMVQ
ncbi:hypothetical protein AALP_AAs71131U000100 [Arabis alpina]|uniref:Uncharacterized protein n=1 Tax=Arabis alpina TaxID=50452 RepID=A0A087G2H5_ARAAL|nr:hypothetical protein AALP_AAs71131U000100 [Arabis alpina]